MTLYDDLGVPPDASAGDIKAAYRKGAKRHHPDANADDPKASEKFGALAHAYEVLSDPARRARYDQTGDDADGHDNVRALADQLIAEHFEAVLEMQASAGFPPMHDNVVEMMRRSVRRWIKETKNAGAQKINEALARAEQWRRLRNKFEGPVFIGMLGEKIQDAEARAAATRRDMARDVAAGEAALALLLDTYAHHPDTAPEPSPSPSPFAGNPPGAGAALTRESLEALRRAMQSGAVSPADFFGKRQA